MDDGGIMFYQTVQQEEEYLHELEQEIITGEDEK